jgi:predicted phosphodiesterase
MKIVVLGDIHGRDIWKEIVAEDYDADCFVFLGDYVSSHDRRLMYNDEAQINPSYFSTFHHAIGYCTSTT